MDAANKHLTRALSILAKVTRLEPPKDFNLFESDNYKRLKKNGEIDIRGVIEQALTEAATEYFDEILVLEKMDDKNREEKYRQCINVIQIMLSDLQKTVEHHDQFFQEWVTIKE